MTLLKLLHVQTRVGTLLLQATCSENEAKTNNTTKMFHMLLGFVDYKVCKGS